VHGVGEVLIAESGGKNLFGTGKPYGAIPGDRVTRKNEEVMDATVEVAGGTSISWRTILEALPLFVEKWRTEDIQNPPQKIAPVAAEWVPEAVPPNPVIPEEMKR
jgi:hypothetical protein